MFRACRAHPDRPPVPHGENVTRAMACSGCGEMPTMPAPRSRAQARHGDTGERAVQHLGKHRVRVVAVEQLGLRARLEVGAAELAQVRVGDRKGGRVMRQDLMRGGLGPSAGADVGGGELAPGQMGGGAAHRQGRAASAASRTAQRRDLVVSTASGPVAHEGSASTMLNLRGSAGQPSVRPGETRRHRWPCGICGPRAVCRPAQVSPGGGAFHFLRPDQDETKRS